MNEKIKLLIVVDTYYPKIDGTLKFVEEFVKRIGQDFEYTLLVPNFEKKKDTKNIKYVDVSTFIRSSGYSSIKLLSPKTWMKIKGAVKNSDIVFAQGPALLSAFAVFFAKRLKKKSVYYMHVDSWDFFKNFLTTPFVKFLYYILKPIINFSFNACTLILVPYHDLVDRLKEKRIKTPAKVVRLGIDIERFSPVLNKEKYKQKAGIQGTKKVIGFVGRISNEKNIAILMAAFKKLPDQKNLHLLMVGDGNPRLVRDLKALENCTVTGFVDNVEDYYKAMDIFVMPSLTETTSLATLEAMSTGLPVIATKVGFIKSYLIKDHNGIFFPRNSSTMLSIKIEKLLGNPVVMEKLGKNARKTVAYSFSWDRTINKIKKVMFEL